MTLPFTRLTAPVYRGHNPRWSFAPESGEGARQHGGRFYPKGVAALYTSLRPETAWLEAQQGFVFKAQPLTLCEYAVDCEGVLDLTDAGARDAARARLVDLACAGEDLAARGLDPPSWALARRLVEAGCAAIVVPSFAIGATERDINVVFWDWSTRPPHRVRVVDDESRLPRDDRSWR